MAETIEAIAAIGPVLADPGETDLAAVAKIEHRPIGAAAMWQVITHRPHPEERHSRVSKGRVFACLVAFLLPLATGALVEAHDAMSGWSYDLACCSDHDCYEITQADLEPVADGWRIRANGDVITTSDSRLKISGDGHWHRCSTGGNPASPTICLYVQAGG